MTTPFRFSRLCLLAGFVCSASGLRAASLDAPCVAGTLTAYISMDGGCSIGIQNFDNFSFMSSGTGGALLDTMDDIEVTPAVGGFTFSQVNLAPFAVLLGQTANYQIGYAFVIDPAPVGSGADLGMDPPVGNVSIDQLYCADSSLMLNPTNAQYFCEVSATGANGFSFSPQDLHVDDTMPKGSWTTGLVPLNPEVMSTADVLTLISLNGTSAPAGFDSVTGDSYLTTSGPEPVTGALAFTGLLAIVLRKRRLSHVRT